MLLELLKLEVVIVVIAGIDWEVPPLLWSHSLPPPPEQFEQWVNPIVIIVIAAYQQQQQQDSVPPEWKPHPFFFDMVLTGRTGNTHIDSITILPTFSYSRFHS